ncbi:MAG: creatininase family protein [Rhodospirillaceae bacterium]|nr:creatininase family protein [Rhodospirillaceae bacterium]
MNNIVKFACGAALMASMTLAVSYAQEAAPQKGAEKARPARGGEGPLSGPRVDVLNMVRPIDIHDTIWIEDMTSVEVRDSIKAGKTTALVIVGGMEDNGPYLPVGKHGTVMKIEAESIARKLGNALVAPLINTAPGNPEKPGLPGAIALSRETYHGVLMDVANSLKAAGFKNILFMGDHGPDQPPQIEVSKALNEKWKGTGVFFAHIPEYYNYADVQKFEADVLNIHEKPEGFHDDYYSSVIVMTQNLNNARIPERIKAKKTSINGVELYPTEKPIADGRKIVDFRADATVKAIQKLLAGPRV